MKRADINRLIWERFPDSHIDAIGHHYSGKTIVHFTDTAGHQHIAEIMQYMGIPVINIIAEGKEL